MKKSFANHEKAGLLQNCKFTNILGDSVKSLLIPDLKFICIKTTDLWITVPTVAILMATTILPIPFPNVVFPQFEVKAPFILTSEGEQNRTC